MPNDPDIAKQFDEHLRSPRQVWLLGAGVSVNAGIPLMYPLTDRVSALIENSTEPNKEQAGDILKFIRTELPDDCHIEHILSHLGDMIALAERAKDTCFLVGDKRMKKIDLQAVHHQILGHIRDVLRWGYKPKTENTEEQIGKTDKPIVSINDHRRFIKALYRVSRAGVEGFREKLHFVTTNYDSLIEDALSLERLPYADGFTGGAIAFWNEDIFKAAKTDIFARAIVTKLHGSIDWYRTSAEQGHVFRVRYDELYPDREPKNGNVVIYPQSTKYMASREDPFGCLFEHFRWLLSRREDQTLIVCGYSFGDDHINGDIELLVGKPQSRTNLVVFLHEPESGLPLSLNRLRRGSAGNRVFIATQKGLYRGNSEANFSAPVGERDWWRFTGVAQLLEEGLPTDIAEMIE